MTSVAGSVKEKEAGAGAAGAGAAGAAAGAAVAGGADGADGAGGAGAGAAAGAPDGLDGSGGINGSEGLGARLEVARAALASVVSELDPARLTGADATGVYESLVGLERLT
ncbi:MAG: hypothetical protein ABSC41_16510, partial [Acidimicrobiales bacterium]